MKLKNQIDKTQKKRDIIILAVFLALSISGMLKFLLTDLRASDIYTTPQFWVSCVNAVLFVFCSYGLVIAKNPYIRVSEKGLLIADTLNLIKKLPSDYVSRITAESNQTILDGRYESEAMIVDIYYKDKALRFALSEKDYGLFINNPLFAERLK